MAKQPRVLLDVDEVIADFVGYYLRIAGRQMLNEYTHDQVTQWSIPEALRLPDWAKQEVDYELRRPGAAHRIEIFPDAKMAVYALAEIADVVFVTAPYYGSQTWAHDRYEWLHHHFGALADKMIYTRHKAPVSGDVFIDDRPDNLDSWAAANTGRAVVWDKPHNRDYNNQLVTRMDKWSDVLDLVRGLRGTSTPG